MNIYEILHWIQTNDQSENTRFAAIATFLADEHLAGVIDSSLFFDLLQKIMIQLISSWKYESSQPTIVPKKVN